MPHTQIIDDIIKQEFRNYPEADFQLQSSADCQNLSYPAQIDYGRFIKNTCTLNCCNYHLMSVERMMSNYKLFGYNPNRYGLVHPSIKIPRPWYWTTEKDAYGNDQQKIVWNYVNPYYGNLFNLILICKNINYIKYRDALQEESEKLNLNVISKNKSEKTGKKRYNFRTTSPGTHLINKQSERRKITLTNKITERTTGAEREQSNASIK